MKRSVAVLLFLALAATASGQGNDIEKEIRQMDQQNALVILKADSAAMVDLLAADFTINRSTGAVVSGRANTLELFKTGTVKYDSFSVQTEFVLVKSPSLAVSMGSEVVVLGGNSERKGQTVRRRFTHIWTNENGKWQLLARHASNVCTP